MTAKRHGINLLACLGLSAALIGCARFANDAHKQIAVATGLADGTMKTYAKAWKMATNGATPEHLASLQTQRSNVMVISFKVGASLNVAERTLESYEANAGTNTVPKAVAQALITTAIQNAGALSGEISVITRDPSWSTIIPLSP